MTKKLTKKYDQAVFPTRPKSHDKNFNILRTKSAFKVGEKIVLFASLKAL